MVRAKEVCHTRERPKKPAKTERPRLVTCKRILMRDIPVEKASTNGGWLLQ